MPHDPEQLDQERVAKTDAAYRAIGRYVVEFSELIWAMGGMVESHVSGHLAGYDTENQPPGGDAVELLLGEATAQYIADVFFAMCRRLADLDTGEDQVTNALSTAVNNVIKERNDIAHGDWVVWFSGTPPWLGRTRRHARRV